MRSPARHRASTALSVAALLMLGTAACGEDIPEPTELVNIGGSEPAPPPPPEPRFITRSRPLMGTVFKISVIATPDVAEPAVRAAFAEIARLEDVLSEWREGSEISRINELAGREPVRVGEDVMTVVKAGLDVSRWSGGAFDLSWAALRGLYSFPPHGERIPDARTLRRKLPLIRYQDIVIDEGASTVFLRRRGMAIGTGGIGKGYALDRAGAILREAGIEDYMIFGGGQVQVHGQRGDRDWRVGIQHPRQTGAGSYFAALQLTNSSISTSGDYEHAFVRGGRRYHHILNLRTGAPVAHTMSVTLIAPSGLYADALSTAAFALGGERAVEMFGRIPYRAEVVMVDSDCRIHATEGTMDRLRMNMELTDGALPGCDGP